ncbi:basic proline-rich protein-like [Ursus maritimus]|uniref:Basic proline-rich protein-like n=1 Tax=Ursus maritimus TaxID=29073 RepID=A0A8M1GTR3_URSMA|nr:basic proline-rich protein-like [Ursus maritimus]
MSGTFAQATSAGTARPGSVLGQRLREKGARARGALAQRPPSPNEPRATAGSGGGLRPRGAWGPEGRPEGTERPKEEKQRGAGGRGARPSESPGPRGTSLPLPEAPPTTRFGGAARRPGPAPKKARTPGCASRKRGHGDRAPPPTTRAELLFPRRRSPWGQRGGSWSSGSSAAAESQPPPPPHRHALREAATLFPRSPRGSASHLHAGAPEDDTEVCPPLCPHLHREQGHPRPPSPRRQPPLPTRASPILRLRGRLATAFRPRGPPLPRLSATRPPPPRPPEPGRGAQVGGLRRACARASSRAPVRALGGGAAASSAPVRAPRGFPSIFPRAVERLGVFRLFRRARECAREGPPLLPARPSAPRSPPLLPARLRAPSVPLAASRVPGVLRHGQARAGEYPLRRRPRGSALPQPAAERAAGPWHSPSSVEAQPLRGARRGFEPRGREQPRPPPGARAHGRAASGLEREPAPPPVPAPGRGLRLRAEPSSARRARPLPGPRLTLSRTPRVPADAGAQGVESGARTAPRGGAPTTRRPRLHLVNTV